MSDISVYQQARLSRDRRFDGQFFVAVKTTKIFCRTICPANLPLEKNVEYFTLAQQAMHHGYRPCLRCHPDSAPKSNTWQGVATTVKRASKLLQLHPELTMSDIAQKLGIGERYFRLLFKKQVGLSPKQFQLFDQILRAKHLLHQSNLSIEQIAQSCGFNSARRLQFQFKQHTGLTPSSLRQAQAKGCQHINLSLGYRPPYNWPHLRDFLARRAIEEIETITENSYSRSFHLGEAHGFFCAKHNAKKHRFDIQLHINKLGALPVILANIERVLDLSADSALIESHLVNSGIPAETVLRGLRLPGVWDPFEAGCRAILGQQISVKAAINLVSSLASHLGQIIDQQLYFPSPELISKHSLDFLKIPEKRKQTLRDFAHFYHSHPQHNIEQWLPIKGIGPWTVAYTQLRGQSAPDIWLESDLVIKHQLKKYAIDPELARPWRSYLTLQLWNLA